MIKKKIIKVFGINFIDCNFKLVKYFLDKGGLLVLPSGPGLSDIYKNNLYRKSLKNADIVLFDSGFLCLLLRIFKNIKVKKFSGFIFLKKFFKSVDKSKTIYLIDPNINESNANKKYLHSIKILKTHYYVAPIFNKNIKDCILVDQINKIKPKYIIINIGGGVQEVLGSYLLKNLSFKPSIICSGAAISFFTKKQAPINVFFDKFYLGWLVRCLFDPIKFIPRYLKSFKLLFVFIKKKNSIKKYA